MPLADIETIVVVILENRSFDHAVGYLSLAGTPAPLSVEGLKDDPLWRDPLANILAGTLYPLQRLAPAVQAIDDPAHDHNSIRVQIETPPAGGAPNRMGGFVQSYVEFAPKTAPPNPSLVMGYYDAAAVPIFDFFARNFAICDHWFSALPTGTQANRLMAMSGESSLVDNARVFLPDQPLVYDWLTDNGVTWCAYQSGDFLPFFSLMPRWLPEITTSLSLSAFGGGGRFRRYSRFAAEWADNAKPTPQIVFIEPEYTDGPHFDPNDDHPPTGIAKGQVFLSELYAALIANPARWAKTMMILTYDEHGGFFDHVPPLPIAASAGGFSFATTGVRVPAFVVSPHVAPGTVYDGALDHTSILQLLADRFTPGRDYSAAVAARQGQLTPLNAILAEAPTARAPAPDPAALAAARVVAAAAPVPPPSGAALGDPPNAQALHNAAVKAARDHPALLAGPGWEKLAAYVRPFVL
jgi:phospholipase C